MRPIEQQIILVTGGTDGHGRRLAEELASRGATVLLHGRDHGRADAARREIRAATGNDRLAVHLADFGSLSEVRALADTVLSEHDRLDVLVNNAGLGVVGDGVDERVVSADGYELRLQVNYLAPFLLTHLLEPLVVRSAPSRIVNVASAGQQPIDFDDLMLERGYSGWRAYRQSKLALVMLTLDLAETLRSEGVTANALHPATFMPTKMVLDAGIGPTSSLEEGVEATLRLAVDPSLDDVSGKYFDGMREARALGQAYDKDARRRLRRLTLELVGLREGAAGA